MGNYSKGQAILELAIFGSILIMLLGVLISYGIAYSSRQKIMQEAFRKALASAAVSGPNYSGTPISVSHSLLKDIHIPNPSDPFAVGSVTPVSARATVTRNYALDANAENDNELPQMRINLQGYEYGPFKAAGFRNEYNVSENQDNSDQGFSSTVVTPDAFADSAIDDAWNYLLEGNLDKYYEIYGAANVLIT